MMKLLQSQWWIVTLRNKIVYQPLPSHVIYQDLADALSKDKQVRSMNRPDTYHRDQLGSLLDRIQQVLDGNYKKTWRSKTSAMTSWAHIHFWKDPNAIYKEGIQTLISTSWLIKLWSWRYINNNYDIKDLVETKDELNKLFQHTTNTHS